MCGNVDGPAEGPDELEKLQRNVRLVRHVAHDVLGVGLAGSDVKYVGGVAGSGAESVQRRQVFAEVL